METKVIAKTIGTVVEELEQWDKEHRPHDVMGRLPHFRFDAVTPPALCPLGGQHLPEITLKDHALNQLCSRLQFPIAVYRRLPEKLNGLNLNWLIQHGAYESEVMIRLIDGGMGRAILSSRFEPFDNLELMKLLVPFCRGGIVRWHFDDELTFHMSVSFPTLAEEIKRGDVVERGIHVSNSEVGTRSVTIAGFVHRLICRNGAVSRGDGMSFRFRHTSDKDRMTEMVQSATDSVMIETQGLVAAYKESLREKLDDPYMALENLAKDNSLTKEEYKAVLDAYLSGAEEEPESKATRFAVSQAFSRAANVLDGERRYEFQRLSADVARMSRN